MKMVDKMDKKFIIKGKIIGISKEEIRAICNAIDVVFQYHNVHTVELPITIHFLKKDLGKTKTGSKAVARCSRANHLIKINQDKDFSDLSTILLHEFIHYYFDIPDDYEEKVTSTLTAKLKPDVIRIANILVENTYQRAGYIAHMKIAYIPKGEDYYDDNQYHENHDDSKGKKYRRIKACSS